MYESRVDVCVCVCVGAHHAGLAQTLLVSAGRHALLQPGRSHAELSGQVAVEAAGGARRRQAGGLPLSGQGLRSLSHPHTLNPEREREREGERERERRRGREDQMEEGRDGGEMEREHKGREEKTGQGI